MTRLIMSVAEGTWGPSISSQTEEWVADLVERYPSYHFFIMEVST